MDQARWLIVFSVVVCMTVTLALLQRYASQPQSAEVPLEVSAPEIIATPIERRQIETFKNSITPSSIKYPKPPAHIFSLAAPADAAKEEVAFRDQGKISE